MLQSTSSDWGYSPLAFAKEAPGFSRGEWSHDKARQGTAGHGKARRGKAWQGLTR